MTERAGRHPWSRAFAYLRGLRGDNGRRERRDVIATVFQGFANRMESGYLLRDVVNLIDGIHFDSSEEVHTLGRLYETLLREMRDAAGDSGEFYTPRPVVRFMVEVTDPKLLGETILDPACGTGGFLTEAYLHLERQADTVEKRRILQDDSLRAARPSRCRSCCPSSTSCCTACMPRASTPATPCASGWPRSARISGSMSS